MEKALQAKIIFYALLAIALSILIVIASIVFNYIEKSKWTFVAVDAETVYETQNTADASELAMLRDPKTVAEMFFYQESYGDSVETKILKSSKSRIIISMKNTAGYAMKAYLIQPASKGSTGIWVVKRYIADPLPDAEY